MGESFPFRVWSGLLEDGHKQRIGSAIWEYLWCIDKVTREEKHKDTTVGLVLGGKVIEAKQIATNLKVHCETVKENLRKLKRENYINYRVTSYGYVIEVIKSKKFSKNRRR